MPCFVKALKLLHTTATNKYPWRNILQDSFIPSGCGHGICIQLICKQIEEVKSMLGKESIDVCSSRHFIYLFYYYSWNWALSEWFFYVYCTVVREGSIFLDWSDGKQTNKQTKTTNKTNNNQDNVDFSLFAAWLMRGYLTDSVTPQSTNQAELRGKRLYFLAAKLSNTPSPSSTRVTHHHKR